MLQITKNSLSTVAVVVMSLGLNVQAKAATFGAEDRASVDEKLSATSILFSSDREAEDVVKKITGAIGLAPNFEIKVGGAGGNAAAVIQNGKRLIIYEESFIRVLTQRTGTKWAAISVMAHEIGHHLSGHTLDGRGSLPAIELEADTFSGNVLQKMGPR